MSNYMVLIQVYTDFNNQLNALQALEKAVY